MLVGVKEARWGQTWMAKLMLGFIEKHYRYRSLRKSWRSSGRLRHWQLFPPPDLTQGCEGWNQHISVDCMLSLMTSALSYCLDSSANLRGVLSAIIAIIIFDWLNLMFLFWIIKCSLNSWSGWDIKRSPLLVPELDWKGMLSVIAEGHRVQRTLNCGWSKRQSYRRDAGDKTWE